MLKEVLQVIELTGYKFKCDKDLKLFSQIRITTLHTKLAYRNL